MIISNHRKYLSIVQRLFLSLQSPCPLVSIGKASGDEIKFTWCVCRYRAKLPNTLSKKHGHEILIATRVLFLPWEAITGGISRVNSVAMPFANKFVGRDNRRSLFPSMQIYLWNISLETCVRYLHASDSIRFSLRKICLVRILHWINSVRANLLARREEEIYHNILSFLCKV